MKTMKKIFALIMALTMVMALVVTANASSNEPTKGTITIQNATPGQTYKAYKVFDATYSGENVSYTVPEAKKEVVDITLFNISTAASNGNYTVTVKEGVTDQQIIDWVKKNYSKFDNTGVAGTFNENNNTVTFSNLDFGYYYITSSLGTLITIDSATPY